MTLPSDGVCNAVGSPLEARIAGGSSGSCARADSARGVDNGTPTLGAAPGTCSGLIATVRGPNAPNRLAPFIAIAGRPQHRVRIVDIAQVVVDNAFLFSIMFELEAGSSIGLIEDFVSLAKRLGLRVDFSFSQPGQGLVLSCSAPTERVFAITVAVRGLLPCALLHGVLEYLAQTGNSLLEIRQRHDDKISRNGDCTKLTLRVRVSLAARISQLYLDLQRQCWAYSAELAVRKWEGFDRPNGKSLVLFGVSEVLCPYDVLDKVLLAAGVDPAIVHAPGGPSKGSRARIAQAKVRALQGKDASCMRRVADSLEFTPGAHLVCRALRGLGFRLAVLSTTACGPVLQRVKRELSLDYAIAPDLEVGEGNILTGLYRGDHNSEAFTKADYLQLMAEREGIDPKNVVIVGSFAHSLGQGAVHSMLNNYGPVIYFHAPQHEKPNLALVLYLLGFSGFDVREMREQQRFRGGDGDLASAAAPQLAARHPAEDAEGSPGSRRYLLRVRGKDRITQSFAALLEPLLPFCREGRCAIEGTRQLRLASGDTLLGLELAVGGPSPEAALKDVLLRGHQLGLSVEWNEKERAEGAPSAQPPEQAVARCVLTVVQQPQLEAERLAAVLGVLGELGVDCRCLERLSEGSAFSALEVGVAVPPGAKGQLRKRLLAVSREQGLDVAFQHDGVERWGRRVVVFDMDSTLIQQEVVDELARLCGAEAALKEVAARALRGELDFYEAMRERVALLKGRDARALFAAVKQSLVYTPGALQLCRTLKRLGYKMAVVSGGFLPIAREVQRALGLDYAFANTLGVCPSTGALTGETVGPLITPQRKRALLSMIAEVEGCELWQTIAVGDGSHDIPMLTSAGLGVAFCAKPKVQAAAEFRVNNRDLSTVLFLIGLSEAATGRLLETSTADVLENPEKDENCDVGS